jgi:hypothetical protein
MTPLRTKIYVIYTICAATNTILERAKKSLALCWFQTKRLYANLLCETFKNQKTTDWNLSVQNDGFGAITEAGGINKGSRVFYLRKSFEDADTTPRLPKATSTYFFEEETCRKQLCGPAPNLIWF